MELLFLVDPLPLLDPKKDSTLLMIRRAAERGHRVWVSYPGELLWQHEQLWAHCRLLAVDPHQPAARWRITEHKTRSVTPFAAVLLRFDPPFDFEYLTATWLLERAARQGARIINNPRAVRDHSEKLAILEFSQWTPPTRIARQPADVHAAIDALGGDVVIKPLDGMGGRGVFRVRHDDPNRYVIVETTTNHGQRTVMVQQFLPAIAEGDKRVLVIAGEVVPWALARIPKPGETRGNLAAGGKGVAQPLTARERQVAEALAPLLAQRGLMLVGLDLIGGYLTEINVTSPTCFVEILAQTGFDAAERLLAAIEEPRHQPAPHP